MRTMPLSLLAFGLFGLGTPALAASWSCTYNGHWANVSFDAETRLLSVAGDDGRSAQGVASTDYVAGQPYREYYLPYDYNDYSYYLRLWNDGTVTFSYCWDCAPYVCKARG